MRALAQFLQLAQSPHDRIGQGEKQAGRRFYLAGQKSVDRVVVAIRNVIRAALEDSNFMNRKPVRGLRQPLKKIGPFQKISGLRCQPLFVGDARLIGKQHFGGAVIFGWAS